MADDLDHTAHVQQLFVEHVTGLTHFVMSLLPNQNEAQDIVQETFITITAKAHDFERGSNFKAWVYTIARFKVMENYRKVKRKENRLTDEVIELLVTEIEEEVDDTRVDALSSCLKKLSPKVSKLVELRYQEGLKPSAIAKKIGWTSEAIYVALSRARTSLKNCIESEPTRA